nr:Ras domain containing protein [Haemonchus contortus]
MTEEDPETTAEEVVLKVVVCGDGSSGKTCLCQRFVKDSFERTYHQTLGLDFFSKRISLPGDIQVLLQVWDIGGQSIAGEMIDKYIYGSHAALIVYDVTNMSSFDNTQDWLNVIRRVTKTQEKPPQIVLVANKVDEERLRKVSVDAHCAFAKQHDLKAFYVSAKTGDSVIMMFRQVAADEKSRTTSENRDGGTSISREVQRCARFNKWFGCRTA